MPTVQQRGAAVIEARGSSSARRRPRTRRIDHVRDWVLGTADGDWVLDGRRVRRLATACPRA